MKQFCIMIASACFGAYCLCYCPVLATATLAAFVWAVGLTNWMPAAGWLAAAPIVYFYWLVLNLIICTIDTQVWYRCGYRKPRRARWDDRSQTWWPAFVAFGLAYRGLFIRSLPMVQSLLLVPIFRRLVLLSYSPRSYLGRDSMLFGMLYDPDLTRIGEGAIIGGGVRITAHSVLTTRNGGFVFQSAEVNIGPRAVIGGESRIGPGVHIGANALIEAGSVVAPFTVIPADEIWGGNPAVFHRKRSDCTAAANDAAKQLLTVGVAPALEGVSLEVEEAVRKIVAEALGMPVAEVGSDFSVDDSADWDSLAQLAIVAALNTRLGFPVAAFDASELRSIASIIHSIQEKMSVPSAVAPLPDEPHNPELLPLFDRELMNRVLTGREPARDPIAIADLHVVIAATFTAEPLAQSLKVWTRAFGIPVQLEFAAYDQVPQMLLAADSPFDRNTAGINVVLVRPEDLLAGPEQTRDEAVGDLLDAISRFADRSPGTLAVATLPPAVSAFFGVDRPAIDRCRTLWHTRLGQIAGVEMVDFAAVVERLGIDASRNNEMEVVARAPYSTAVYRELGIEIARIVRGRRKPAAKVLALDADGVLWGGVIAEDGTSGIQLGPDHPGRAFQLFQRHVLQLKQRGILLVLVSRNQLDDVWQMIDEHPEMILRRSDFAAARVNWQPKSQNLRELAKEMNLGLDAFVFVDDDPANRLEVETNADGVTVVPLPVDAAEYCQTLSRLWCFDAPVVTDEDRQRTAMMRQEQLRQEGREPAGDIQAYLNSLDLVVQMRPAGAGDLPRVAQLTQKTNQFNLSLRRRSLAEIQAICRDGLVFVINARDRFGDYGLVGACILDRDQTRSGEFQVDTLLLSCRALGRGVEEAILYGLRTIVEAEGGSRLVAPFVDGPRNLPVREFLARNGFCESTKGLLEHNRLGELALPGHVAWEGPRAGGIRLAG